MYKILISTVLFLFFSINSYSQKGYYANDTLTKVGIKIIDGGSILNSRICQVITGDTIIRFTPYEINEYGIFENKIYVAKNIHLNDSTKRVFLELLVKGTTTLYYYKDENYRTFFITKDTIDIIEIPEREKNEKGYYKSVLRSIAPDCPAVLDATNLVTYNKKSVTEFINRYNKCEDKPFPFWKFGFIGGYDFSKLANPSHITPTFLEHMDYRFNGYFICGLFSDIPILPTNFSVHLELYHSSHKYSETVSKENKDYDLTANQNSFKMPVLLRYSFYSGKINPYVNAGGIMAFNYNHHNNIYITTISNNIIEIDVLNNASVIPDFQYGFSAGAGIERKINRKNALFVELRYNKLYGISNNLTGNNEIQLITGINF